MAVIGIICEYNPFHLGHERQLRLIREQFGPETAVVCLMSGNYVQRGTPAVFDKFARSRAAAACGADLVLELPLTCALSSAEGFAQGGTEVLDRLGVVDGLSFGSECGDVEQLQTLARLLLDPAFDEQLRYTLKEGTSFAAARAETVRRLGGCAELLQSPNNILAVEYCKALARLHSTMVPSTICREGGYHDERPDPAQPSATALRKLLAGDGAWEAYMPPAAAEIFRTAPRYGLEFGERAVLARLRTMGDAEFEALPGGSEGLWNRVMKACRREDSVEAILQASKSKRYARSRLMRMLMCAYLGLKAEDLTIRPPYVRLLAFNSTGRQLVRQIREKGTIPLINAGQTPSDAAYWALEQRASALYGLFSRGNCPARLEEDGRIASF